MTHFTDRTTRIAALRAARLFGFATLLAGTALAQPAMAADMLADETQAVTQVEYGTGWYLRGEIGFTVNANDTDYETLSNVDEDYNDDFDISDGITAGIAVGHRFTDSLRGELSFQFLSQEDSTFVDRIASSNCPGQRFGPVNVAEPGQPQEIQDVWSDTFIENCSEHTAVEHNAQLLMANGYLDLGTYGRFSPFVGAGVGVARINYTRNGDVRCVPATDSFRCRNDNDPFTPLANEDGEFDTFEAGEVYSRPSSRESGVSYHLAGTLTGGVAYQVSQNLFLDTSYSYTRIAEDPFHDASDGLKGARMNDDIHQVKLGLRYEIW